MLEFMLPDSDWPRMPEAHRAFLVGAIPIFRTFSSLSGVAAGGSFISHQLDEYSDLDLIVVSTDQAAPLTRSNRQEIASRIGPLLVGFTGEHVNEPRLLICLYGSPVLHVDLKFLSAAEINPRVEDPIVLWDRQGQLQQALDADTAAYPPPDLQWIEDRFWVWIHYASAKVGRGELFEALDLVAYLRKCVLGPLALQRAGVRPNGVRRFEDLPPTTVSGLVATVGAHDPSSCCRALSASIALYREHRAALADPTLVCHSEAEVQSVAYLDAVRRALGLDGAA